MLDNTKNTLRATADKLRANLDAAEYKHLEPGLIFLEHVSAPSGQVRLPEIAAPTEDAQA